MLVPLEVHEHKPSVSCGPVSVTTALSACTCPVSFRHAARVCACMQGTTSTLMVLVNFNVTSQSPVQLHWPATVSDPALMFAQL